MTLLEEIRANCTPEQIASRDETVIAGVLNHGRKVLSSYWLTDRGLVAEMMANTGNVALSDSILNKFDAAAQVSRSVKAVTNRLYTDPVGIDFGDSGLRAWFESSTPSIFTVEERNALLALAMRPAAVDVTELRRTMWADDGEYLL